MNILEKALIDGALVPAVAMDIVVLSLAIALRGARWIQHVATIGWNSPA